MSTNHFARTYVWWVCDCAPHPWFVHLPYWHFSLHLPPLQLPGMYAVENFQRLIFGSLPTSSQERLKHKSTFTFTFTLRTIYKVKDTSQYIEICWTATDNNTTLAVLLQHQEDNNSKLAAENRTKIDIKNPFQTNGILALLSNDRRRFPSLSQQNTTQLSQDIISSPCRCSDLKRTRYKIYRRRKHDNEGCKVCHYDATARRGQSAEIDGEITAGHDINADREGFAYHLVCPFLAPLYSVFHTPELGRGFKSNNLGNGQYVFLRGLFTPSTRGIYSLRKNATLHVG